MKKTLVFALISISVLVTACGKSNEETAHELEQPKQIVFLAAASGLSQLSVELFMVQPVMRSLINYHYIGGENIEHKTILTKGNDLSDEEVSAHFVDADVIITVGDVALETMLARDLELPVVFIAEDRTLTEEIRESIAEGGANLTGVVSESFDAKQLDFLFRIDPTIQRVLVLYNPELRGASESYDLLVPVAELYEATLVPAPYTDATSALDKFNAHADDVDAVFIGNDEVVALVLDDLAEQALDKQLPVSSALTVAWPDMLMAYGPDMDAAYKATARFTAHLLDGKPIKDLPIEYVQPKLVISLIAAETLGLEIPNSILRQANVILRPDTADEDN